MSIVIITITIIIIIIILIIQLVVYLSSRGVQFAVDAEQAERAERDLAVARCFAISLARGSAFSIRDTIDR